MPDSTFENMPDNRMNTLIHNAFWNEALGRANKVLVPLSEGIDSRPAFYCVHALSGVATVLIDLAQLLGPEQPFFAIQAPVEKRNAEFAASIEGIAKYYADALMEFQPTGPLVLGGWSVGSIIALEMAQQIRARGREDILLVNIDCELLNTHGGISKRSPTYYWKVARNFPLWLIYDIREKGWSIGSFNKRVWNKLIANVRTVRSRIIEGKLVHGHAVNGFMDISRFSPGHKAFVTTLYEALFRYVPANYPWPVLVYEAVVQPIGHLRQVGSTWRKIAEPEIVRVMGTHATIIKAPDGTLLASHLRHRLAKFAASSPS